MTKKSQKYPVSDLSEADQKHYKALKPAIEPPIPQKHSIQVGQIINPDGKGGFQKGISGNPMGNLSDFKREFRELAKADMPVMYNRLKEVILNCDDANVVLKGLMIFYDRTMGRIPVATEEDIEKGLQLGDPSQMTAGDMRKQMGLMIEMMRSMIPKDVIEGKIGK